MNAKEYRRIREKISPSRKEVARALGVSRQTLWNRETGKHPIDREAELALLRLKDRGLNGNP